MKKLALISILTSSLALMATPALARDYDNNRNFSARHHYEQRQDVRHYSTRDYDRRDYDHRGYDRHDYRHDYRHDGRYDKHYAKPHPKYYRCGYHPGYRGHHDHHHYYDSRTGEYLAIIGGTILITELLHGHH
ncbi:hypothetical protein [Porticoccus sp.]